MKNYIKIFLLLLIVVVNNYNIIAQENAQAESLLPNINPPSVESFKFVEFGKNQANEYTGKIGVNIPIYEYSAGNLKMPISLGYSGAGVKVEDTPTWTGINWNLNVGGVITRQVKDGVDEAGLRVVIDETHLKNNAHDLCAPASQYYWALARNEENHDTEFDIFNFNFMGYSGSFYLDANFNPVYLENENEVQIKIIGNSSDNALNLRTNNAFLITTPDGKKFYFGGEFIEETMVLSGSHSINTDGVTSYFLHKVEDPINGVMLLEYDSLTPIATKVSKSYSMSTFLFSHLTGEPPVKDTEVFDENFFVTRVINPKRLKKIKSPNSTIEILFNRSDYSNFNYSSVLNSIEVINTILPNPTPIHKTEFTYLAKTSPNQSVSDFTTASRFFLTQIEFNKNLNPSANKYEKYTFDYDDAFSLPSRMSNSRDALGYYNGVNNTSLIPKYHGYEFDNNGVFANLNPSFAYAKKGSLIKITYPTKGYSIFEYESVPSKKDIIKRYGFTINSYPSNGLEYPLVQELPGLNALGDLIPRPNIYRDQTIAFTIDLRTMPHTNPSVLQGKGVEFVIKDVTDSENVITTVFTQLANQTSPVRNFNLIKNHLYTFKLQFKDNYISGDYGILEATVNFDVFEGYQAIDGLGIRIKRNTNYNFNGTPTNKMRYYYGSINGEYNNLESVKGVFFNPKLTLVQGGLEDIGLARTSSKMNGIFSSEIVTSTNKPLLNDEEKYNTVSISYGGDNFEKGGVEKVFLNISENYGGNKRIYCVSDGCWGDPVTGAITCGPPPYNYGTFQMIRNSYSTTERTTNNYYNGKLLSERTYTNKNGALFKINESINQYKLVEFENKKVINFIGRTIFDDMVTMFFCPENSSVYYASLSSCYFGYNTIKARSFNLEKTITKSYITPVPLTDYVKFDTNDYSLSFLGDIGQDLSLEAPPNQDVVEAPYKKVITTQTYEYGTLKGLPTKVTSTVSDGSAKSTENVYVNQAGSLSGLTANQSTAYTALLNQNNVASPIETHQLENGTLLSKQRTTYQTLAGNKIVPAIIQTAKGSANLEDRAVFEEYDSKGNPTLMALTGGSKIKYVYNNLNQVIAKIENFTGTLDPNTNSIADACSFINQYPNSQVSVFKYDAITNLLVEKLDANCQKTTYIYDALYRLKQIKDNDNNVIQEFDNNYRPN